MTRKVQDFNAFREKMNARILEHENLTIRRFFNLDSEAYREGTLGVKVKEMLGLATSMALRCDDCVQYHLQRCREEGLGREEIFEVFGVALLVGGSVVIPHLRRAVEFLDALEAA